MSDSVMGRSVFEDSYYEEDGINGNQHIKQRKCEKFILFQNSTLMIQLDIFFAMLPSLWLNKSFLLHDNIVAAFFSPDDSSGISSCTTSDSLNPTHRAQSAFIPRHSDEVLLDIGDAIHVDRTCEDHWCYGRLYSFELRSV
ncbi:unnamed protein product [Strongylus vulgaris]|uniref:Uncharacterized protein n=1 Tax=Strongylus vulgaris TaxID=40348 RepID=A0A3P7L0T5_STRVU|nr:unnamed protein product [Strongylus vulgaris]